MIELYELAGRDEAVRFSPYCWRTRMALAHKGLHAQLIAWHFGEDKLPGGLHQVPVLVDNGKVIADSTAIAEYLEAHYVNGPGLFGCEGGEAHTRFIVAWVDTVLQPCLLPALVMDVLAQVKPEAAEYFRLSREARLGMSLEQASENRMERLKKCRGLLAPVRKVIEIQEFLGGEEPSYADYAVFSAFQWVRCVGGPEVLEQDDLVYAWRERMLDLFDGFAREAKTPNAS
jgi:glutathione S-transferase